jgi:predicted  nucleic acid-binding Zn-ribbon protein
MVVCFLVVLGAAAAANVNFNTGNPVAKVVELLKDLKSKTEADGATEQKIYDKYACWCENTAKAKASAIVQAKAEIRALSQSILKYKGLVATLTAEIKELSENIAANQKSQDDATAVRTKENNAYMAETTTTKQALASLENAVKVLSEATMLQSGATSAVLLQSGSQAELRAKAAAAIRLMLQTIPSRVELRRDQISLLSEFAKNGAQAEYAPQSASIQCILKDMYDTFSSNLEKSTQTEASKNRSFEDFIAAKHTEMIEMKTTKGKKESQKAEAETNLAKTTQICDETTTQMEADIAFFDATKKACQDKAAEWKERTAMRNEELAGIKEATKILNSDESRALFAKAIKPGMETSFLQLSSHDSATATSNAFMALKQAATEAHSTRLASLAAAVRMAKKGHFAEVITAIDEVEATLKDEGQNDIETRDHCNEEYQDISVHVKDIKWQIKTDLAHIEKLKAMINDNSKAKAETIEAIKDTTEKIAQMEAERIAENEAFLSGKSEDEAALALLTSAKDALSKFYKKNTLLLQQPVFDVSENQAPDASFSDKGSRKNQAGGIVGLMEMLIEDLTLEIKNGIKNEATAQSEFEEALTDATTLKKDLIRKKDTLEGLIAQENDDKTAEWTEENSDEKDLKEEKDYKSDIKPDCDWMIGAFKERSTSRATEMKGLVSAKEYLSGASASSSSALQLKTSFDDTAFGRTRFMGLN